ncbi:MAG: AbrB/MazE/SpoVT family DNA-binding protein [Alphaproteobacteria bacterium]|nr:AbrB/MazE/SpoVT family DNA-binding protein [Alphaproteobacteria bacterium]
MLTVKNRSSKISPGGVVTLPLSARKALGMEPKIGARVTVAVDNRTVVLHLTSDRAGARVSPRGQMEMIGEARRLLEEGEARHFWLEADDERREVALHPYRASEA